MKLRNVLTVILLVMGLAFVLSAWAQEKPFTEQQVLDMVRAGLATIRGRSSLCSVALISRPRRTF